MEKNFISIIIPTYNRSEALIKCLNALFNQSYPKSQYEIIIVDDGSTDDTEQKVKSLIKNPNCSIKYLKQENKGPAAARNLGIKNAKGDIMLFIGDDIITTPNFLKEHDLWHKKYPQKTVAILGYTTWSPELEITPYMKWLENGGPQFHYQDLKHGEFVPYNYFYTSNISLKKEFIKKKSFNELFPYAAYEDIELSFRLQKAGLKIIYNKKAKAFHCHKINLKNYSKRAVKAGIARALLAKLHKNFSINKKGSKEIILFNKITMPIWLLVGKIYETKKISPKLFRKIYNCYFNKGIIMGLKQNFKHK